jgi:CO/xanthine dehydrogenase Mo-binding subunit
MDPVELRRKNFIQPEQFPYFISNGNLYNSGNYEGVLDKVLELTDFEFWHEEQRRLREGEGR